jgi:hypothetical protein
MGHSEAARNIRAFLNVSDACGVRQDAPGSLLHTRTGLRMRAIVLQAREASRASLAADQIISFGGMDAQPEHCNRLSFEGLDKSSSHELSRTEIVDEFAV